MKIYHNTDSFKGGWFVGNFSETAYKTEACEVAFKTHYKNEEWPNHYHKLADEINYLIEGSMSINGTLLEAPIVFVIEKNEPSKPVFHTDCKFIVVKVPGVLNDKYNID